MVLDDTTPWGPTGRVVFERTYSRTRADGTRETWPETVRRVARGNLALVYGQEPANWPAEVGKEYADLCWYMERFALLPGGRHLWATGVPGRQYLFNCWASGWGDKLSEHFEFTSMRLFEGGGVGANYSSRFIKKYGTPRRQLLVHITGGAGHADYAELEPWHAIDAPWLKADNFGYHLVGDSREGWAAALGTLIDAFFQEDFQYGGHLVFDVGGIRPSGSPLVSSGGTASGPGPLARMLTLVAETLNRAHASGRLSPMDCMAIDHYIAEAVVSGGTRRSARMSILHWDDPYIMDFIRCKQDGGAYWTTNISVEVDDKFFALLGQEFDPARCQNHKAFIVHRAVVEGMLANGEPGYWNSSKSQEGELGDVVTTNPCGEIALEPWEPCNLGHVNLDAFAPTEIGRSCDIAGMREAHRLMTRFLIRATFADVSDPKSRDILDRNRRIGVGHLGVQGFWAKMGVKYSNIAYGSVPGFLEQLYKVVRQAAQEYSFELRIPEPVKVTTVAPTGSIAKLPGVSEGIHPVYARYFERRVRFSLRDDAQFEQVQEFGRQGFKVETDVYDSSGMTAVVVFPTEDILVEQIRAMGRDESVVESADEIRPADMLRLQRMYQECWADNAVSYTVNIPRGVITEDELAALLAENLPHLKGTTVMVDDTREQAPYTRITRNEYEAAAAKTVEDSTDELCASGACPVR